VLTRRIVACLDVRDGIVVKGVRFRDHQVMGDPVELAKRYRDDGVDELVFYDIAASAEARRVPRAWIEQVARVLDVPFCVAGGIRSVEDAREVLHAGADKISTNSPALERPQLVRELAEEFGSQCVVVGIDSRRDVQTGDYLVYQYTGVEAKTRGAGKRAAAWAREVEALGAGEIVLNCMDHDGVGGGYDVEQLAHVRAAIGIPLVASGGAKTIDHFADVFTRARVDAALAAGVFHRREITIRELKNALAARAIAVRP
jgi:imidazole glycerol-phosphate synthase subunit HisF